MNDSDSDSDEFNFTTELMDEVEQIRRDKERSQNPFVDTSDEACHYFETHSGNRIVIEQNVQPGCGGRVWQAAYVMTSYLNYLDLHKDILLEMFSSQEMEVFSVDESVVKNIIELGSGTGVVGLFAQALFLDSKVFITDLDEICPVMQRNVNLNNSNAIVAPLRWGSNSVPSILNECRISGERELILISDCVYLEACFNPLLDCLFELMKENPRCVCLMSYKRRRRAEKRFFNKLKKIFCVDLITNHPEFATYSKERLFLYKIHLNKQN